MENNLFTVEVLNVNELESVKGGKTVITKTETRPDGTVVTNNENRTRLTKSEQDCTKKVSLQFYHSEY